MSDLETGGQAQEPTTAEEMIADVKKDLPDEKPEAPASSQPAWKGDDWAFETGGKKIVPDSPEKLRTWASQGYNYSQRVHQLNRQTAEWQAKEKAWADERSKLSRYAEIDQYAAQNPDWWKHVSEQYQQRGAFNMPPEVAPLVQRLEATEGVLKEWKAHQEQARAQAADQAVDEEIQSFAKATGYDLAAVDESGKSLELRILEHAGKIGTHSFQAAARDYLHEKLIEQAKAEARTSVAKSQEQARARGIIGQSSTPTKGLGAPVDVRGKSYNDLAREAMAELGIG